MKHIKEEIKGDLITLWDVAEKIAISFKKQDYLARYTHAVLLDDLSILETEAGVKRVNAVAEKLVNYGAEKYPENFETIKWAELLQYQIIKAE